MSMLNRRNALTAAAALPALTVPVIAAASIGEDVELLALGEKLASAWRAERALPDDSPGKAFDEAYDRSNKILNLIEALPARTLQGLKVKAFAVHWCWSGDPDMEFNDSQTTDVRLAQGLVRDLLVMAGVS
jgi:hypothetical protein